MNIERAQNIYGWMTNEELKWLAEQASRHLRILEVGCCLGRSARALADNTSGSVTCVDVWEDGVAANAEGCDYASFDVFSLNLADLIASGKVKPVKMWSVDAAKMFQEQGVSFDMIFIDAGHDYDNVKADIETWSKVLAPGGLLCGHDYYRYSGLDRAVQECVPDFKHAHWPMSIWHSNVIEGRAPESMRRDRKVVFTLNVENYAKEITELTYPLLRGFANHCNADFYIINERRFPELPLTFEKLQIFELSQHMNNDWNIYLDSDAVVHPDTFDPTEHLSKDTVLHNGRDMAGNRFRYDKYFRRDGRHIGSGNWFTVASDWCIDLWRPPDDQTLEEILGCIKPTLFEQQNGITPDHLIDDYTLSRNIAKFGLKFTTFTQLLKDLERTGDYYFWHQYTIPVKQKVAEIKKVLAQWGLREPEAETESKV